MSICELTANHYQLSMFHPQTTLRQTLNYIHFIAKEIEVENE